MTLFGGRLPIISVNELCAKLLAPAVVYRLDIALCKELDKYVVRVTQLAQNEDETMCLGLLVDEASADYFVAGRTADAVQLKLERVLGEAMAQVELVLCKTIRFSLFGDRDDAHSIAYANPGKPQFGPTAKAAQHRLNSDVTTA